MANLEKLSNTTTNITTLSDTELETISGGNVAGDMIEGTFAALGAAFFNFIYRETPLSDKLSKKHPIPTHGEVFMNAIDFTINVGTVLGGAHFGRLVGKWLRQKLGL